MLQQPLVQLQGRVESFRLLLQDACATRHPQHLPCEHVRVTVRVVAQLHDDHDAQNQDVMQLHGPHRFACDATHAIQSNDSQWSSDALPQLQPSDQ